MGTIVHLHGRIGLGVCHITIGTILPHTGDITIFVSGHVIARGFFILMGNISIGGRGSTLLHGGQGRKRCLLCFIGAFRIVRAIGHTCNTSSYTMGVGLYRVLTRRRCINVFGYHLLLYGQRRFKEYVDTCCKMPLFKRTRHREAHATHGIGRGPPICSFSKWRKTCGFFSFIVVRIVYRTIVRFHGVAMARVCLSFSSAHSGVFSCPLRPG